MRIILCVALLLSTYVGFGRETIEMNNTGDLRKVIKEYTDLDKKGGVDLKSDKKYARYRSLGDALEKHFNEHPEDFKKINFNRYQFKSFCSFARPELRKADKVYCEIIMRFIQTHQIDPKSRMFWEWALSDFARTEKVHPQASSSVGEIGRPAGQTPSHP